VSGICVRDPHVVDEGGSARLVPETQYEAGDVIRPLRAKRGIDKLVKKRLSLVERTVDKEAL
jgi:hypothetical protein